MSAGFVLDSAKRPVEVHLVTPGDYIDDYCSRCKRSTDHAVVAMIGDEVGKVRCRACNNEHKYRTNQAPLKKAKSQAAKGALARKAVGSSGTGES